MKETLEKLKREIKKELEDERAEENLKWLAGLLILGIILPILISYR